MPTVGLNTLSTFDEEDVTIDATAGGVGLTQSLFIIANPAKVATITVESAQIRWTKSSDRNLDAASRGHIANVGSVIFLDNLADIYNFRAIRTGSTSASLHVEYAR